MATPTTRDDAGKFLPHYVEQGILTKDPFVSIDVFDSARFPKVLGSAPAGWGQLAKWVSLKAKKFTEKAMA